MGSRRICFGTLCLRVSGDAYRTSRQSVLDYCISGEVGSPAYFAHEPFILRFPHAFEVWVQLRCFRLVEVGQQCKEENCLECELFGVWRCDGLRQTESAKTFYDITSGHTVTMHGNKS